MEVKTLSKFVSDRTTEIADKKIIHNPNYGMQLQRCRAILDTIKLNLPHEYKELIDHYEAENGQLQTLNDKILYAEALKDGIALARLLWEEGGSDALATLGTQNYQARQ